MKDSEQHIIGAGLQQAEVLPSIAGGDGRPEPSLSRAAMRRLIEKGREARRVEVAIDVAANGHGHSRTVKGWRNG